MKSKIIITTMVFLLIILNYQPLLSQDNALKVSSFNPEKLMKVRAEYQKGNLKNDSAVKNLLKKADQLLEEKLNSIVDKEQIPPGGSKHDFLSMAPYHWPNPDTKDKLPYIRKDGEKNPEVNDIPDDVNKNELIKRISTFAKAYYVSNDVKYSIQAIKDLQMWFADTATKMNPNLNYAQYIKGVNEGRSSGIIDVHKFYDLIDGIMILESMGKIDKSLDKELKLWFNEFYKWLQTSKNGKKESEAKNNHGTWYDVLSMSIATYLGYNNEVMKFIEKFKNIRMKEQLETDGRQPFELERTKAWSYSLFNIRAMYTLALIAEKQGADLWNYKTSDGKTIKAALDFILPYANNLSEWKYKEIGKQKVDDLYQVLRIAVNKYEDKNYKDYLEKLFQKELKSSVDNLLY